MSKPLCSYCGDILSEQPYGSCPGCDTPHHEECWRQNRGCTLLGCGMSAAGRPDFRPPPLRDVHYPPGYVRPASPTTSGRTAAIPAPRTNVGAGIAVGGGVGLAVLLAFLAGMWGSGTFSAPASPLEQTPPAATNSTAVPSILVEVTATVPQKPAAEPQPPAAEPQPSASGAGSGPNSPSSPTAVVQMPQIISRSTWGAAAASGAMAGQRPDRIILTHDAQVFEQGSDIPAFIRRMQTYHMRNWPDIAWHYIIGTDGRIYEGRPAELRTNTSYGFDTDGIIVVGLIGDYDVQTPSPAQSDSIVALMAWLCQKYGIASGDIYPHRYFAPVQPSNNRENTSPGNNVDIDEIRRRVQELL
jgi:hypothetical protein